MANSTYTGEMVAYAKQARHGGPQAGAIQAVGATQVDGVAQVWDATHWIVADFQKSGRGRGKPRDIGA
jgi:hypothetical protein